MLKKIFAFGAALIFLAISNVAIAKDDSVILPPLPTVEAIAKVNVGCTAWHVGGGFFVTAAHCVEGMDKNPDYLKITLSNGKVLNGRLAFFASHDLRLDDIAIIKVSPSEKYTILEMSLDCSVPSIGTDITMTGFPGDGVFDFGKQTHFGKVASGVIDYAGIPWSHFYWGDFSAFGGFSGSAVQRVDNGKVVGMLVGSVVKNMSMTLIVPTKKICQLLEVE